MSAGRRSEGASPLASSDRAIVHGRYSNYANNVCRCDECKRAWATYHREHRAAHPELRQRPRNVLVFGAWCEEHGLSFGKRPDCECENTTRLYKAQHPQAVAS